MKIFKRIFFGKKEFAKKCEFKNPEVLDFKYDRKSGQFKAISEGALVFINNALGYEVTFFLEEYYAELFSNDDIYIIDGIEQGKPQSLKKGLIRYKGIVHFKELIPKNEKQKKAWQKNRLIAYNGSQRHFFKALSSASLKQEGFKIYGAKRAYSPKWTDYILNIKDLLKKSENEYLYILSFPEFLKVIYTKEKNEIEFEMGMELLDALPSMRGNYNAEANLRIQNAYQLTWITIIGGKDILININGIVISKQMKFDTYGYWGWDSPAESLPDDYQPY